jgi:hypothetical protein
LSPRLALKGGTDDQANLRAKHLFVEANCTCCPTPSGSIRIARRRTATSRVRGRDGGVREGLAKGVAMAKTTTPLTAQERVILFCTATGVSHAGGLIASGWHTAGLMTRLFMDHYLTKGGKLRLSRRR